MKVAAEIGEGGGGGEGGKIDEGEGEVGGGGWHGESVFCFVFVWSCEWGAVQMRKIEWRKYRSVEREGVSHSFR